jgi:hypothetical protein
MSEIACLPSVLTPTMPFETAFDLLFVRGNFEKYFPSCWDFCKAMETPNNDEWIQAICTSRLMQLLPHPMFGVLLLTNEVPSLEESIETWRLAKECCVAVVDVELLVRVMRIFCPFHTEEVLFDGAWRTSQLYELKTYQQWLHFGKVAADGIAFTRMWWNQDEAPFFESRDMRSAIFILAKEEEALLKLKLVKAERRGILAEKRWRRANKGTDGKEPKKQIDRFTKEDQETAEHNAKKKFDKHVKALLALKTALERRKALMFEESLSEIVANLSAMFPRVKWQLKALLHTHFTRNSTWEIERLLHGYRWFVMYEDPMAKLAAWEAKK